MKTFILRWNPEISSVNLDDWDFWIKKMDFLTPNWSIYEHEKLNCRDEWYMLRVGRGEIGIVGHGIFCSNPQRGGDWSGQGKVRYYADLYIHNLVPHSSPMITTDVLEKNIPNIDWRKGHSGMVLSEEDANKLAELKKQYYQTHPMPITHSVSIEKGIENEIVGWENLTKIFKNTCNDNDYIYSRDAFANMVTLKTEHIYGDSIFTYTILLQNKYILPIVCKKLKYIKTDIYQGVTYESFCKIWHDGYHFHININDVEVICEELEFCPTTLYKKDYIALTI